MTLGKIASLKGKHFLIIIKYFRFYCNALFWWWFRHCSNCTFERHSFV